MMAPVSLPEAAKSETSSTSVDMAGRIFHFWLQDEGDQEFMCTNIKYNSHVLHDPSDEKDDESDKDSVDEPFDVINDMKKNKTSPHKINSPAQPPRRLARLTKYLDTSTIWSGTTDAQTVGDASQSDHVSASSLNDIMTTNVDSSHQFESTSDPGHPNSDFHRRLNHRRRLQRIRQLEESGDEATKTTPLHSYGAPPQSPTSEDEATDTTSVHSNGARPQSPTNLQDRSLQAWRSSMKTLQSKKNINTVSFGEQNKVHHLEPAMTDESSRWTEDKSEVTSVQSEYSKTDASEVEDAIKDIFFLGDGKKSRPGRRKRSDRNLENGIIKQGATTFVKQQKLKAQSTKRRSATKASDAPMAAVWQMMEGGMTGLVSALGISPSVDENDEESKVDQRSETSKFQTYVIPRDKEEHIPSIDLGSCPSGSTSGEDNMTKTGVSTKKSWVFRASRE
jgi:phage terminase small subunit